MGTSPTVRECTNNNRIHRPQMREWVNNVRWQCGLTQLHWVSSCSDPGKVFAQTFGIAGILKGGATFISCCAVPRALEGTAHILQMRGLPAIAHLHPRPWSGYSKAGRTGAHAPAV
jgi:hypothetical protein